MGLKIIDGTPTAISKFLRERESLSDKLRIEKEQFNKTLQEVNQIYVPKIDKLIEQLGEVRSKLHDLGVPAEDC